ncbi:MAG TPA: hypothetical protein VMW83_01775 [Spirochaetia bacterium]|nr:hypothetical protein [Spirochaetia bacterium]
MARWGGAVLVLFLVLVLALGVVPARAAAPLDGGGQDTGTLAERLISLPIEGLTKALDLLGLVDIQQLVFVPSQPLSGPVLSLVLRWYTQLMVVCFFLLALVFAWHAAWLGKAVSATQRAQAKAGLARWAMALGAACFALALVQILFALNNGLVSFAAAHAANFSVDAVQSTGSVLATAVINLGLAALKLYFNLLYTVRLVFIVVLLAISPLVIWSLALRSVRGGFALWAAELFANIMMQASHALTLAALVSLLTVGPTHTLLDRWFAKIVVMTLVVPIGQFLRNLISSWLYMVGLAEDQTAGLLGGLTHGLANLGRMVGWGGGSGGGFTPPGPGEEGGNDYQVGGWPSDSGAPPGGLPGGGVPGGLEGGWGTAAVGSGVAAGGGTLPAPYGGAASGGPGPLGLGGGSGESYGEVGGGRATTPNPPYGEESSGGGRIANGSADGPGVGAGWPGSGETPVFGRGEGLPPGSAGEGTGWPPTLDAQPDWRGLGETGELPLEF